MDSYRPHQKWMWYTDAQYHLVQRLETGEWKKFQLNNRGSHGRQGIYKYSRGSVWKFRCSLLHGHTIDETWQRKILQLQHRIKQAYKEYTSNPFNVHHGARPLDDRLQHDEDGLRCFLRTYELAHNRQKLDIELQANAMAHFFLPKSLPTVIRLSDNSDISKTSSGSSSAVSYSDRGDYTENGTSSGLSGFQGPLIEDAI